MTLEEFTRIKESAKSNGQSGRQYCLSHGIPYHKWIYWSRKVRLESQETESSGGFIRLQSSESRPDESATWIESPTGWRIHTSLSLREIISVLSA